MASFGIFTLMRCSGAINCSSGVNNCCSGAINWRSFRVALRFERLREQAVPCAREN